MRMDPRSHARPTFCLPTFPSPGISYALHLAHAVPRRGAFTSPRPQLYTPRYRLTPLRLIALHYRTPCTGRHRREPLWTRDGRAYHGEVTGGLLMDSGNDVTERAALQRQNKLAW